MDSRWHDPLGMTAFFVLAALAGATIAYPLWLATDLPWDKVLSRSVLLCAGLLLWPLLRFLGIDRRTVFGTRWRLMDFAGYWLVGLVLILPPALLFLGVGFRVLDPHWHAKPDDLARAVLGGLVGGLLAALLEEAVFRGVLLATLVRSMRPALAVAASAVLYAGMHFLRTDFAVESPDFAAGFVAVASSLEPLLHPALWWDSFFGLFALGVLLALVRLRTASLLPCIALHAAWIFFLRIYKELAGRDVTSPWSWLVGGHDNFTGLVVAVWLLVLIVCYLRFSRAGRAPAWR